MGRSRMVAVVLLVSMVLVPAGGTAEGASRVTWSDKIAPEITADLEPGAPLRYLVMLTEQADLSAATALPNRDQRRRAVVDAKQRTATRSQAGVLRVLREGERAGLVGSIRSFWVANVIAVESTASIMRAVAMRAEVERILPNRRRQISAVPSSDTAPAAETAEWNIDTVGAPDVWDLGITGEGAVVASIDTGVDPEHPSVASKYRGADGNHDYDWWDAINELPAPYDDNAHGTHTMGTMLGGDGLDAGGDDIGVAPGATWIAAKAFDEYGGGWDDWILSAAQFLTAPTRIDGGEPRPELAPDVVNNSWGGGWCDDWFDEVMSTWRAMDIFPAFAIGNWGPDEGSVSSPGDRALAFSVGATDINDEIAWFSSRGPNCDGAIKPEVSAPGEDVRSSVPGGGFASFDGTSMATPHIAGAVALMVEASADTLTVPEAEEILRETALDLGISGVDNDFGAGKLQTLPAVELVLKGGLIEGIVRDALGVGIPGARLIFTSPERTVRILSKPDGSYRARLLEGSHTMQVRAFGYLPVELVVAIAEGQTLQQDVTMVLAPIHELSGTVRETPGGAPLDGATIRVLETPLEPVTSAADGTYVIPLPAGIYDVSAIRDGCRGSTTVEVNLVSGDATADLQLVRKLDAFGYVCDETTTAAFEPGTTKLALSGWYAAEQVSLPFAFPYYGWSMEEAWVTTAGFVSFGDEEPTSLNSTIPSVAGPNGAIYGLWDSLSVRGSVRGVYTRTLGTAPNRRFIIEYRNFEMDQTGDLVTFAIVLFEDGAIEVRYKTLEGIATGSSATVGIEDPAGVAALEYSLNRAALREGSTIRFEEGAFGRVAGTITSAADGLPVQGATLAIDDRRSASAPDGTYRISAFDGSETMTVSASGYESQEHEVSLVSGQITPLDIVLDAPALTLPDEVSAFSDGPPVSLSFEAASSGTRPVSYTIEERSASGAIPVVLEDPDDGEIVDVTSLAGGTRDGVTNYQLVFTEDSALDTVSGFILLDTDRNPSTGYPPDYFYGSPGQDIGVDFFLDLFDVSWDGSVYVWSADWDYMGRVEATWEGSTLSFGVPVGMIANDDGVLDVAAVLGDWWGPTDWVPDTGHGTIRENVDLPWLDVEPREGSLAPGATQTFDVTLTPIGLSTGEHQAFIVFESNDPRRPEAMVLVRFSVVDTGAPTVTVGTSFAGVVTRQTGMRVSGTAADAGSGIASVSVGFVNLTGGIEHHDAQVVCDDEPVNGDCVWFAAGPSLPGPYQVTAVATDRDGNQSTSSTVTLVLT